MSIPSEQPRVFQPGEPFLHYQYDIKQFLGAGASGQVYAMEHRLTGDRFAVKTMHLKDVADARKVQRNIIEVQATYRIQHYNVVDVVDLGCEDNGLVWQRMELLVGQTLAEMLRRYGRLSPLYALDIALEVAFGLREAHDHLIIHRDIKPSNVFFTFGGAVKVTDFSLAKVVPADLKTTTEHRPRMGTLGYMAPEQMEGAPPTVQMDVFGLGVLLRELMTGANPLRDVLAQMSPLIFIGEKHYLRELEPLERVLGLPAYVDDLLRRAMAAEPAQRFAGMWPFVQAILATRERLLRDSEAAWIVRHRPAWEGQHPIVPHPLGWSAYLSPTQPHEQPPPPATPLVSTSLLGPVLPTEPGSGVAGPARSLRQRLPSGFDLQAELAGKTRLAKRPVEDGAAAVGPRAPAPPPEQPTSLARRPASPERVSLVRGRARRWLGWALTRLHALVRRRR